MEHSVVNLAFEDGPDVACTVVWLDVGKVDAVFFYQLKRRLRSGSWSIAYMEFDGPEGATTGNGG